MDRQITIGNHFIYIYLITSDGARRLGKKIPLTPEEVEALR
ncbi:hypothetical protein [Bacteroides sp. 214]|nr:hypothetical protein [Bacteroides sp. 214]